MGDIIHEAGWPIYPILFFGFTSLLFAWRYARQPRREVLAIVVGFGLACIIMGCLGTVLGVMHTISGVEKMPPEDRWIFLIGLRESLNCIGAALFLALFDVVLICAGLLRRGREANSETAA